MFTTGCISINYNSGLIDIFKDLSVQNNIIKDLQCTYYYIHHIPDNKFVKYHMLGVDLNLTKAIAKRLNYTKYAHYVVDYSSNNSNDFSVLGEARTQAILHQEEAVVVHVYRFTKCDYTSDEFNRMFGEFLLCEGLRLDRVKNLHIVFYDPLCDHKATDKYNYSHSDIHYEVRLLSIFDYEYRSNYDLYRKELIKYNIKPHINLI